MEGSNYEDNCGQQANDVGGMSNHRKRNDKSKKTKRIEVNRNRFQHSANFCLLVILCYSLIDSKSVL